MLLPEPFSFSQNNLQDYVDCQRRFYLRHIQKLEWPAIESEPVLEQERLMELGRQFHLMVQQKFSGVPEEIIAQSSHDKELLAWWAEFTRLAPYDINGEKYCEAFYSIPFAGHRLVAKMDLLIVPEDGNAILYDWKTSQHAPKRATLQKRMQTRVYRFLLARLAKTTKTFKNIQADQIKMIYWYPNPTIPPFEFPYSEEQYSEDEQVLTQLIEEITALPQEAFVKTSDERKCRFCRYRSLCERGTLAGNLNEAEEDDAEGLFDLDFDQLAAE